MSVEKDTASCKNLINPMIAGLLAATGGLCSNIFIPKKIKTFLQSKSGLEMWT